MNQLNSTLNDLKIVPAGVPEPEMLARAARIAPGKAAAVLATVLADALRNAERYVEEYKAGRGAE